MRIGIVAARVSGVDGVTFETAKWADFLQRIGHSVRYCVGEVDRLRDDPTVIPDMALTHGPSSQVTAAAFDPGADPATVRAEVDRLAGRLLPELRAWLEREHIELVIVENAWAIPMHLPLAVALRTLVEQTDLPAVGHHHDYWWERERFAGCIVPELLETTFPPALPSIRHVSINSLAAGELRRRRGLRSTVIPNVFDFGRPTPPYDPQVRDRVRGVLGLPDGGKLVVQPTRVVPRKGIELAIDLVSRMRCTDSVLLVTGPAGDEGMDYLRWIERYARESMVRLCHAAEYFGPDVDGRADSMLTLPDAYQAADVITYPSHREGFGSAILQAVFYGTPLVVNRYPVYDADIRSIGLQFIELGGKVTNATVAAARRLLADPDLREDIADHNRVLARRHLSYGLLEQRLCPLLETGVGTDAPATASSQRLRRLWTSRRPGGGGPVLPPGCQPDVHRSPQPPQWTGGRR